MNRLKNFIEWKAFGVCAAIGEKNGYRYFPHSHVVYVYLRSYARFAHRYLYGSGVLDEYETLHICCKKKPVALFVIPVFGPRFSLILIAFDPSFLAMHY